MRGLIMDDVSVDPVARSKINGTISPLIGVEFMP